MTTIDEILNRQGVGTDFSVICRFCRLRLSRSTLKFSTEIFAPYGLVPALEWVHGIRSLFLTILLFHLLLGIWIHLLFVLSINLSRRFFEGKFLMHPSFPNLPSPQWECLLSKFLPRSIHIQYISGNTFLPNWWGLDKSRVEIGCYSTIAPERYFWTFEWFSKSSLIRSFPRLGGLGHVADSKSIP